MAEAEQAYLADLRGLAKKVAADIGIGIETKKRTVRQHINGELLVLLGHRTIFVELDLNAMRLLIRNQVRKTPSL